MRWKTTPWMARITCHQITVTCVYDDRSWLGYGGCWSERFQRVMSGTDAVVAGTDRIAQALRAGATGLMPPMWIVHPGAEEMFGRTSPCEQRGRALWVGNTASTGAEHKGLPLVRDACSDAGVGLTEVDACRVGTKHDEMPEVYAEHDMLVLASESEGAPRPLLEALASGIPVVTTRTGLATRLVHHGVNGVIVKRDRESLVAGIRYVQAMLADNPEAVSERCRLSVEPEHTETACVMRWTSVLQQLGKGASWRT
jgi:glycosyltransferase involved in cell wall biosynthesis